MSDTLWYPEHPAGHARFCARPYHSLMYYCAADPAEPAAMRGEPSQAWIRGHAEPATGEKIMNDKTAPGYAGPAGRERPGEPAMSELVRKAARLMMGGLYEPGQYVKSAHMRAGYLHEDGQGGAWFYAETDEENTGVERVRVTITPA